MATIERFEDLQSWQAARLLRQTVYRLSREKSFARDFSLVNQIRRAAISGASNIAEGFERGGNRELIQFLSTAKGSIGEVKDQLYCALDESYISREQFDAAYRMAENASRLVGGFMTYLRGSVVTGHKFDHTALGPVNSKPKTQNPKL
jgi:four helix bundle protein